MSEKEVYKEIYNKLADAECLAFEAKADFKTGDQNKAEQAHEILKNALVEFCKLTKANED